MEALIQLDVPNIISESLRLIEENATEYNLITSIANALEKRDVRIPLTDLVNLTDKVAATILPLRFLILEGRSSSGRTRIYL